MSVDSFHSTDGGKYSKTNEVAKKSHLVCTDDNDGQEYYTKCNKCGMEYFLESDFVDENDLKKGFCKNWDCAIQYIRQKKYWLDRALKMGQIQILNHSGYDTNNNAFSDSIEEWFENLEENSGFFLFDCSDCGKKSILTLNHLETECVLCWSQEEPYVDQYNIIGYDETRDRVDICCKKCNHEYQVSCKQFNNREINCPKCSQPITSLGIPVCALSIFKKCGINTIADILSLSPHVLLKKGISKQVIVDLMYILDNMDLRLKGCAKHTYPSICDYLLQFLSFDKKIKSVMSAYNSYCLSVKDGLKKEMIQDMPIEILDLSSIAYRPLKRYLKRYGATTIKQLLSIEDIAVIPSLGRRAMIEIENKLALLFSAFDK